MAEKREMAVGWWVMWDALTKLLITYINELVGAIAVAATFWAGRKAYYALRDWRQILTKLVENKKARDYERLTKILIDACSGSPQVLPQAFIMFAAGLFVMSIPIMFLYMTLESTDVRNRAFQNAEDLRALSEVIEEGAEAASLSESAKRVVSEYGPKSSKDETAQRLARSERSLPRLYFAQAGSIAGLLFSLPFAAYVLYKWVPRQITAISVSAWLEQCVLRLIAIASQDEARRLVSLEVNVVDEKSLWGFLTELRRLSMQHQFDILPSLSSWLTASEVPAKSPRSDSP